MWRQLAGFTIFGAVLATLSVAFVDAAARSSVSGPRAFAGYIEVVGDSSWMSVWNPYAVSAVTGAVVGLLAGALCWVVGIRLATRPAARYFRTVTAGIVGIVVGLIPTLLLLADAFSATPMLQPPSTPVILAVYGISAVLAYVLALAAVYGVLRAAKDGTARTTVRWLALTLPVTGVLATAAGVGTASRFGFATDASTWVATVLVVVLVLAAGLLVGRAWALRGEADAYPATTEVP